MTTTLLIIIALLLVAFILIQFYFHTSLHDNIHANQIELQKMQVEESERTKEVISMLSTILKKMNDTETKLPK